MTKALLLTIIATIAALPRIAMGSEPDLDEGLRNAVQALERAGGKLHGPIGDPKKIKIGDKYPYPEEPVKLKDKKPITLDFPNTFITDIDLESLYDAILQIPNLTTLDLSYTRVKGETLSRFAKSSTLVSIDLSNTPISPMGMRQLTRLRNLTSVSLNGTYLSYKELAEFAEVFKDKLQKLELSGARIFDIRYVEKSDAIVFDPELKPVKPKQVIALIAKFSKLTRLYMAKVLNPNGSTIEKEGIKDELGQIFGKNRLYTELDLSYNNLLNNSIPPAVELRGLTILKLSGNKYLTDEGLGKLWPANSVDLHSLIELDLSGTFLTNKVLSRVLDLNVGLDMLSLSGTPTFTDDRISFAKQRATLRILDISNTGINNDSFSILWGAVGIKLSGSDLQIPYSLEILDISGTSMTDKGLATTSAAWLRKLEKVIIADSKMTPGGVARLNALKASTSSTPPPNGPAAASQQRLSR
jgi:internalin A